MPAFKNGQINDYINKWNSYQHHGLTVRRKAEHVGRDL
jgi:hypothetical protein